MNVDGVHSNVSALLSEDIPVRVQRGPVYRIGINVGINVGILPEMSIHTYSM
jgi:hypothetical protein